jgi:hypothetical protein
MIKSLYTFIKIKRTAPFNLQSKDISKFPLVEEIPVLTSMTFELKNISFLSNGVFFEKNKISKLSYPIPTEVFLNHYVNFLFLIKQWILFLFSRKVKILEDSIIITDLFSSNYYHWFMEALPRLHKFKDSVNKNYQIILPYNCKDKEYIKESLNIYGIRPYFINQRFQKIKIEKVLFLPHITATGKVDEVLIKSQNKLLVKNIDLNKYDITNERVYISREKASVRRVLNEDQIISLLRKYNFNILQMEDYSWIQQVQMISHSKIIVAPHGAGLSNILFLKNKAHILELLPVRLNNTINTCYYNLSVALDHKYYYQLRSFQDKAGVPDGGDSNYSIDIVELEANIISLLNNSINATPSI